MLKTIKTRVFLSKVFIATFVFLLSSVIACVNDNNNFIYEVHFIDFGQGDAIYISTPDKNLLVDGGGRNSGVVEYLQALDVDTIHYVIGTHPHADHIGGLIDVFQTFIVVEAIDPGVVHTTITFNDYLSAIDESNATFTIGRQAMEWQLSDDAYLFVLHPTDPSQRHLNDASIVARVVLGEISVLLTGDAERNSEEEILASGQTLKSHILKVGHHGSRTSTSDEFLQAISPEVSVIMVGEGNRYGHPHNEIIELLHEFGTEIYRTDIHGHIVIETDGTEYTISTSK
jgi:competence protein ComEC